MNWRKAVATSLAGASMIGTPLSTKAHSAAFLFGEKIGAEQLEQLNTELADPEAAAKKAAEDQGLSGDDVGSFEGGWISAYNAKFNIDKHTGEHFGTLAQADAELNNLWQTLTPAQQQSLKQAQRVWIQWKNKLPAAEQLTATQERIQFIWNWRRQQSDTTQERPAPSPEATSEVSPRPTSGSGTSDSATEQPVVKHWYKPNGGPAYKQFLALHEGDILVRTIKGKEFYWNNEFEMWRPIAEYFGDEESPQPTPTPVPEPKIGHRLSNVPVSAEEQEPEATPTPEAAPQPPGFHFDTSRSDAIELTRKRALFAPWAEKLSVADDGRIIIKEPAGGNINQADYNKGYKTGKWFGDNVVARNTVLYRMLQSYAIGQMKGWFKPENIGSVQSFVAGFSTALEDAGKVMHFANDP